MSSNLISRSKIAMTAPYCGAVFRRGPAPLPFGRATPKARFSVNEPKLVRDIPTFRSTPVGSFVDQTFSSVERFLGSERSKHFGAAPMRVNGLGVSVRNRRTKLLEFDINRTDAVFHPTFHFARDTSGRHATPRDTPQQGSRPRQSVS